MVAVQKLLLLLLLLHFTAFGCGVQASVCRGGQPRSRDRGRRRHRLALQFQQGGRSEEHTSELQSPCNLVCRLLLEKKKESTRELVSQNAHLLSVVRAGRLPAIHSVQHT